MVIKNIVRVVVAGAIGGPWWFGAVYDDPEDKVEPTFDRVCGCRNSSIVFDPLVRACTTSLGTICFGSLVDFPAYLLSKIVTCLCWLTGSIGGDWDADPSASHRNQHAKPQRIGTSGDGINDQAVRGKERNSIENNNLKEAVLIPLQHQSPPTLGMHLKIQLRRLDRVLQFCNQWSYTYIGMYNYSYYEGGEKAIQLFETREWMDIARDTLIQNILLMTSMLMGGLTGLVAVLMEEVDGYEFTSLHKPILTSFLIGFFVGSILSFILLLGVAGSAVNTVLVCFAAEPFEFDRNHPHLSREMREVWSQQVWEPDGSDN